MQTLLKGSSHSLFFNSGFRILELRYLPLVVDRGLTFDLNFDRGQFGFRII